jgi:hypothetical protein
VSSKPAVEDKQGLLHGFATINTKEPHPVCTKIESIQHHICSIMDKNEAIKHDFPFVRLF